MKVKNQAMRIIKFKALFSRAIRLKASFNSNQKAMEPSLVMGLSLAVLP